MLVSNPQTIATYYQALLDRASAFVGIFYVGVKTTSVFCIATCRARKPKLENVLFYTSAEEAVEQGFRPCKICKPTENAATPPKPVVQAMEMLRANPQKRLSDSELRSQQISPEFLRRWFNKNYGMTFHAYQRMQRINSAFEAIKRGEQTTATAFDTGYESLSGFAYTYKKILGESPQNSKAQEVILVQRFSSPLGPMFAAATERGICLLEFADRPTLEKEFKALQKVLRATIIVGENAHLQQLEQELAEYFAGQRQNFEVALQTPGTAFQQLVWESLQKIPFGHTTTYQAQAAQIKRPKAVRALATANASNRVAIVIPCHRVIGKNAQLRGYGGGIERKRWLLELEQKQIKV